MSLAPPAAVGCTCAEIHSAHAQEEIREPIWQERGLDRMLSRLSLLGVRRFFPPRWPTSCCRPCSVPLSITLPRPFLPYQWLSALADESSPSGLHDRMESRVRSPAEANRFLIIPPSPAFTTSTERSTTAHVCLSILWTMFQPTNPQFTSLIVERLAVISPAGFSAPNTHSVGRGMPYTWS